MRPHYDLLRMLREIAEDETVKPSTNEHLSQADINRLVKSRKRAVPRVSPPPVREPK